jgi:hypothetical protein
MRCTPRRRSPRMSPAGAAARSKRARRLRQESARATPHRTGVRVAQDHRWIRKVTVPGLPKVDWLFVFASAGFNLIRLPKLLPRTAG